jgi:hypothetical protein|tara:strand:- start:421 stop:627 length:207 start_codon:yes stop_codon:yes gene_type:complete
MNLRDIQDELSTAYQLDLEQGVAWMNDEYAAKWQKENPLIWAAIMKIMDLDAERDDLQEYEVWDLSED